MTKLDHALAALREAQRLIGEAWAERRSTRTPRMADVVSLLGRGESKLKVEADRHRDDLLGPANHENKP